MLFCANRRDPAPKRTERKKRKPVSHMTALVIDPIIFQCLCIDIHTMRKGDKPRERNVILRTLNLLSTLSTSSSSTGVRLGRASHDTAAYRTCERGQFIRNGLESLGALDARY